MRPTRREFLKTLGTGAAALAAGRLGFARDAAEPGAANRPNVILCMTDDQGWADTGYNGHKTLKTPNLDAMSKAGLRFDRWYSGAPVCSPTRGSCITGRHPYRYGITFANVGHMKRQEITLAEALKTRRYTTGHFGKWHLGTLTTKVRDSNRGRPGHATHYSTPAMNGFDVYFSTEAKVPTWDPMKKPGRDVPYGTHYWSDSDKPVAENLDGDDSRVIMDRAEPFIRKAVAENKPFFACVWFHTPHLPCVAGPMYLKMYQGQGEKKAHYYGCITAMDDQMGRLRKLLRELNVADNTMVWFSSDNGPEGGVNSPGRAEPFRGRKRSLYEGGVRVPGLLEWPAKIKTHRVIKMPCSTSDYFPTVLDALGFKMTGRPMSIDGVSLLPLIEGRMTRRPRPIGFQSAGQVSLTDNRYKLIRPKGRPRRRKRRKKGAAAAPKAPKYELYDLIADPGEKTDIAARHPDVVKAMAATLEKWQASCKASNAGKDYR